MIKWLVKKHTTQDIERLFDETRTSEKTLILNCEDAPFNKYYPNYIRVYDMPEHKLGVDHCIKDPSTLPFQDNEFKHIACTGWLEHLKDPQAVANEIFRVTAKGGTIAISASSAFSIHCAPNDFFHFTPYGIRLIFERSGFRVTKSEGSCLPYKALAILTQRVAYQTEMNNFIKVFVYLAAKIIPIFDKFVKNNYGDISRTVKVYSCLSSNVQLIAVKP